MKGDTFGKTKNWAYHPSHLKENEKIYSLFEVLNKYDLQTKKQILLRYRGNFVRL